jgi:hypothetical protein
MTGKEINYGWQSATGVRDAVLGVYALHRIKIYSSMNQKADPR